MLAVNDDDFRRGAMGFFVGANIGAIAAFLSLFVHARPLSLFMLQVTNTQVGRADGWESAVGLTAAIFTLNSFVAILAAIAPLAVTMLLVAVRLRIQWRRPPLSSPLDAPFTKVASLYLGEMRSTDRSVTSLYVSLLLVPWVVLFYNGLLFGFLLGLSASTGKLLLFLARVLPHGGVEIPTLAFAAATGLTSAKQVFLHLREHGVASFPPYAWSRLTSRELWATMGVIFVLLAVAAVIETQLTPVIADFFGVG